MTHTKTSLWAVRPESMLAVMDLIRGVRPSESEIQAAAAAARPARPQANKLAVIPVYGILTNDGPAWYGSNYQGISAAVEAALADATVKRIVLAVDSPGGQVTGIPEAAAVIAAAAKMKPVSAIVEGMSASAAYWLTSQASDITLTPSGEVGSVGVRMMHLDISKALEDDGVKVTELHAGEHKTEWSPYKPLSDGAQADMQTRLDAVHRDFVKAIASGRGSRASASIRANRYGEGRMVSSADALAHGLVDKIQSARNFYRSAATEAPVGLGDAQRQAARAQIARMRL